MCVEKIFQNFDRCGSLVQFMLMESIFLSESLDVALQKSIFDIKTYETSFRLTSSFWSELESHLSFSSRLC
jgi:hypothetical protein